MEQWEQLQEIITKECIRPVFQPILSLKDGSVFGFEVLSRTTQSETFHNVEEMFRYAENCGCIWRLEQVCRRAALREISRQKEQFDEYGGKLFINVNPKVLHDEKFRVGFTREYTQRYGIETERIVFEITERERIENETAFRDAINHYKMQNYQIAIDDVGAGYSGLNRVCMLSPNYLKLDISLVRDVYKNPIQYAMIKGMVEFSHNSGVPLIAEGIESEKELELLIDLGVQYGQGYYLSRPSEKLQPCSTQAMEKIRKKNNSHHFYHHMGVSRYYIKNLVMTGLTVAPNVKVEEVLSYMEKREDVIGICVVNQGQAIGVLTREKLFRQLSGRYGFSLYHKIDIIDLADKNFLQVDAMTSISNVARIAMERDADALYDFIVVKEDDKYIGIVTIQALLKKAMEIDVDLAKSANPLTGLPGNIVIDQEVKNCVESGEACTFFYFDLDNFKAFNDVYGFEKGDEVIRILAEILKASAGNKDFVGHIGGDDFVMICKGYKPASFSEQIRIEFEARAHQLYTEEDRKKQCITTRNRHGEIETFPLVSVTIVSLSNETTSFGNPEEVVNILANYKKTAKIKQSGGKYFISAQPRCPLA